MAERGALTTSSLAGAQTMEFFDDGEDTRTLGWGRWKDYRQRTNYGYWWKLCWMGVHSAYDLIQPATRRRCGTIRRYFKLRRVLTPRT